MATKNQTSARSPLFFLQTQLIELLGDVGGVTVGTHFLVDEKNLAVFADEKRPTVGDTAIGRKTP